MDFFQPLSGSGKERGRGGRGTQWQSDFKSSQFLRCYSEVRHFRPTPAIMKMQSLCLLEFFKYTELCCRFMDEELREPSARGCTQPDARFTKSISHKSTQLSMYIRKCKILLDFVVERQSLSMNECSN